MLPSKFKSLVLMLGSFNANKTLLKATGFLEGSGAESIWLEANVYGAKIIQTFIKIISKTIVRQMKSGKARGPDHIPPEALKTDVQNTVDILYPLFKQIWNKFHVREFQRGSGRLLSE